MLTQSYPQVPILFPGVGLGEGATQVSMFLDTPLQAASRIDPSLTEDYIVEFLCLMLHTVGKI